MEVKVSAHLLKFKISTSKPNSREMKIPKSHFCRKFLLQRLWNCKISKKSFQFNSLILGLSKVKQTLFKVKSTKFQKDLFQLFLATRLHHNLPKAQSNNFLKSKASSYNLPRSSQRTNQSWWSLSMVQPPLKSFTKKKWTLINLIQYKLRSRASINSFKTWLKIRM